MACEPRTQQTLKKFLETTDTEAHNKWQNTSPTSAPAPLWFYVAIRQFYEL
jgi:hypothetical protein